MRFVKIVQYAQRPSLKDCALAMRRERRGWLAEAEASGNISTAYEDAERELRMLDAEDRPAIETRPAVKTTPAPTEPKPLKFLRDLAESTVVIDEEENLDESDAQLELDAQAPVAGAEDEVDEDERSEIAADAAAKEEENPEGREDAE